MVDSAPCVEPEEKVAFLSHLAMILTASATMKRSTRRPSATVRDRRGERRSWRSVVIIVP